MSETAQRDGASTRAAQLGGELRARRQSLGWELPDLAQSLRIRQAYLEAIEAGHIDALPGATYALGFVRAYASALGLQGEQVAGRFRAETAAAQVRPALSFPAPVPQRGVPAGALMLLGLVILAGSYAGWYYLSEHQRTPAETVPPIPDHLLPAAEKPTPSPQVASILPNASPPAPQPTPPAQVTPQPPAQAAVPASTPTPAATTPAATAPLPSVVRPGQPAASGPAPSPAPAPVSAPPPAAAPPSGGRLVVKANADAWVTIKPPGQPPVFNKLMHAGETWAVPADKPGLLLTTGNAGGTELDVDGTAIPTLGPSGAVRRDLKLDADALKAGPLPPLARKRVPVPAAVSDGAG